MILWKVYQNSHRKEAWKSPIIFHLFKSGLKHYYSVACLTNILHEQNFKNLSRKKKVSSTVFSNVCVPLEAGSPEITVPLPSGRPPHVTCLLCSFSSLPHLSPVPPLYLSISLSKTPNLSYLPFSLLPAPPSSRPPPSFTRPLSICLKGQRG